MLTNIRKLSLVGTHPALPIVRLKSSSRANDLVLYSTKVDILEKDLKSFLLKH